MAFVFVTEVERWVRSGSSCVGRVEGGWREVAGGGRRGVDDIWTLFRVMVVFGFGMMAVLGVGGVGYEG